MPKDKTLDVRTAIKLGEALFNFMGRKGDESDLDDFGVEDAGLDIRSGFIEIDRDALWTALELLDNSEEGRA